ncbi:unnamed protein product [Trichobilharzia szidati]|nr:unnamed protein product [Trichobilharzia szidati]
MATHPLIEAGSTVMLRAIELEKQLKLTESFVCYQESIGLFIKALRSLSGNTQLQFKERLKQKISEYMSHAEKLKDKIRSETATGKYHEQITIEEGATGYGYKRIFGRFLEDGSVSEIWVEDPYIRNSFQIENFSHFCEVVVGSESNVKNIYLTTGLDVHHSDEQIKKFQLLKADLNNHSVCFEWTFSNLLHDREIRFDNGWIVKIGRGLDYIRRPVHKFCGLGVHDYEFRQCSATTVDIFHSSTIR